MSAHHPVPRHRGLHLRRALRQGAGLRGRLHQASRPAGTLWSDRPGRRLRGPLCPL